MKLLKYKYLSLNKMKSDKDVTGIQNHTEETCEDFDLYQMFLTYNMEIIMDIYEDVKEKGVYTGILDLSRNSSDLVSIIMKNLIVHKTSLSLEDTHEDQDFETL
jgi:hypothetical protein